MTYTHFRRCAECGYEEERQLSAREAAFIERRCWSSPCGQCGLFPYRSSQEGWNWPAPTEALLEEWIRNDDLRFEDQDEEICIGDAENLPLLERFLNHPDALPSKRQVLLEAICVVLYDHATSESRSPADEGAISEATEILKRNIRLFDEHGEMICDYIKEVVYPRIGLPITGDRDQS